MAHEPKLEAYTIHFQATKPSSPNTFGAFLSANYTDENGKFNIKNAYKQFFSDFIVNIDDSYYPNDKRKKAIGIKSSQKGGKLNRTVALHSDKQIIEGKIKGGRYGQRRSIGDMNKPKNNHVPIANTKIVLDDFYFQLYTPFGSTKGILLIQSYSDDQINDIFIGFIRDQLKTQGFYKPNISNFCPTHIQDEFKENSFVKELKFRQEMILPEIDETETINSKNLIVEIKITAKENGEKLSVFNEFKNYIQKFSFFPNTPKSIPLSDFKNKLGTLANEKHQSSFELDSNFDIKPTIYLKNRIRLQDDYTPEWDSLKEFCDDLLDKIKVEVYPENDL